MSKTRLSKLQKWILKECFTRKNSSFPNGFLTRWQIINDYFGRSSNRAEASTSRCLRNLAEKGLVIVFTTRVVLSKVEDIMNGKKLDIITIMAINLKKEGKTVEDFLKEKDKLLKQFKPYERLLSPTQDKRETIKAITLTKKGVEKAKCLKLSSNKKP